MAIKCCKDGLGFLGRTCDLIPEIIFGAFLFETIKRDGTVNSIDLVNDTLNQAYFQGKLDEADVKDRWRYISDIDDVVPTQEDSVFQTTNTGNQKKARDGRALFQFNVFEVGTRWLKEWLKTACADVSVIFFDIDGNLMGKQSADKTKFLGYIMDKGSFDAVPFLKQGDQVAYVATTFRLKQSEKLADLAVIASDTMEADADVTALNGTIPIEPVVVSSDANGVVFDAFLPYGNGVLDLNKYLGGAETDFVILDKDTGLPVAFTGIAESDGRYTITYDAPLGAGTYSLAVSNGTTLSGYYVTETLFEVTVV